MNFKVFANFIMLASVGILGYGAQIWMQADKEAEAIAVELRKHGLTGELPQPGSTADLQRKAKREEAQKYFLIGGVVFLLGAGMSVAAKEEPKTPPSGKSSEEAKPWDVA
jgi:hypothetical protein